MDIDYSVDGQGQRAYKAGSGQQERQTGPLAKGVTVNFIFDTAQTGTGTNGSGSFEVTQPGVGGANMKARLDGGKEKGFGLLSGSYDFPRDVDLTKPPTRHVVSVTVDADTDGLTGKLTIQGHKTDTPRIPRK